MKLSEAFAILEDLGFDHFDIATGHEVLYIGMPDAAIASIISNNNAAWLEMEELGFHYSTDEGLKFYV